MEVTKLMKKGKKTLGIFVLAIFVAAGLLGNVTTKPKTFTLKLPVDHN